MEVQQAIDHVLAEAKTLDSISVPLRQALGAVLATRLASDVDSPPHDKSLMDGYGGSLG